MPQELAAAIRTWAAQRGTQTKWHLTVDAHDMPVRIIITAGSCSDISQAFPLVEGMNAGSSSRIKPIAVHRLREQL